VERIPDHQSHKKEENIFIIFGHQLLKKPFTPLIVNMQVVYDEKYTVAQLVEALR
jgi:hypothetical protein